MDFFSPTKSQLKGIDLFSPSKLQKKRKDLPGTPLTTSKRSKAEGEQHQHEKQHQQQHSAKKQATEADGQKKQDNHVVVPKISQTPSKSAVKAADRFIPHRGNVDTEYSYYCLTNVQTDENILDNDRSNTPSQRRYKDQITNMIKSGVDGKRLIDCRGTLASTLGDKIGSNIADHLKSCREAQIQEQMHQKKPSRTLPSLPYKVLDAPDILNDYYLNLLHWGSNNVLAVAIGQTVYLWHPEDGSIENLVTLDESHYITSVQWNSNGQYLAVGTSNNLIQLYDSTTGQKIRDLAGHHHRVSSLSWCTGFGSQQHDMLSSGGKDSMILNHDHRVARNVTSYYTGHAQEVCGLAWSPDGTTLASGGNENLLCIWDAVMSHSHHPSHAARGGLALQSYAPRLSFDNHHVAAVKAVSWCPWQRHLLATGGGTADRTIKLWNTSTSMTAGTENLFSIDTGSQVCAIQWSDHYKELISSHGFSDNQLCLWRYNTIEHTLNKVHELRGHTARVLYLAKSPDGQTICSASADESIRFWQVFDTTTTTTGSGQPQLLSPLAKMRSNSTSNRNGSTTASTSAQSQLLLHTPGNHLFIR